MEGRFQCPYCKAIAKQDWQNAYLLSKEAFAIQHDFFLDCRSKLQDYQQNAIANFLQNYSSSFPNVMDGLIPGELSISTCQSCEQSSVWITEKMVYPKSIPVASPNSDLNADILAVYQEAASIVSDSPKGAAALLRLALQMVMVQLGEKGKNINDDIKSLVAKGLTLSSRKLWTSFE